MWSAWCIVRAYIARTYAKRKCNCYQNKEVDVRKHSFINRLKRREEMYVSHPFFLICATYRLGSVLLLFSSYDGFNIM